MSVKTVFSRITTFFSRVKVFVNTHTIFRVLAAILAFAITGYLLWGASDLLGNPIMYAINKSNAEKYLAENYGGEGYVLKSVSYNFKFGVYSAVAEKPNSEDCKFVLYYGKDGSLRGDDYENRVKNGDNTRYRLEKQYGDFANSVLKSSANPYSTGVCYGELVFEDRGEGFGLPKSILAPDKLYDIAKLGAEGGLVTVNIDSEQATPERAAEVLVEIDKLMEQGGVPFYAINLTLQNPEHEYFSIESFRRADIRGDGLVERINENRQNTEERFDKMYKEKFE